ncbi:MAG TPA: hypothetical protein VJJ75_02490 [Candidatus Nanoarchaeia archaeon]|nr:hypothetical protein [Candidatus Nanoarchaeia archaeon]
MVHQLHTSFRVRNAPYNNRVRRFDEFKDLINDPVTQGLSKSDLRKERRAAEREAWQESSDHMRHIQELEERINYGINEEQRDIARTVLLAAFAEHYRRPYAKGEPDIDAIIHLDYLGKIVSREELESELREAFNPSREHAKHNMLLERLGIYIRAHYKELHEEILSVPI